MFWLNIASYSTDLAKMVITQSNAARPQRAHAATPMRGPTGQNPFGPGGLAERRTGSLPIAIPPRPEFKGDPLNAKAVQQLTQR